jgi:spore coat polysaccharide biosynthesis predicted glycosyltransferase SpsG
VHQTNRLIFRCDGASLPEIGTGHVVRDIAIADALVAAGACQPQQISFVTRRNGPFQTGYHLLERSPYAVMDVADEVLEWNSGQEAGLLAGFDVQLLIIDRLATEAGWMKQVTDGSRWTVTLDDVGSGAAHADLVINGILHNLPGGKGQHVGYEYLFLGTNGRPAYRQSTSRGSQEFTIVASFGGYDNRNLTGFFLRSLLDMEFARKGQIRLELLVGQESDLVLQRWQEQIAQLHDRGWKEVYLYVRTPDYFDRLTHADLAVVSGGLTVFDAVSAGVPVIGLPQYPHQLETLQRLESKQAIWLGSREMELELAYFSRELGVLLNSPDERLTLVNRGSEVIDGEGDQRVLALIMPLLTRHL